MSDEGADGLPDWRDADAYKSLLAIDRAGLMWEWLRRDPGYAEWYLEASRATTGTQPDASAWGAHFR
ncbi:transcriptional regulator domain-containing protein [Novosphingobium resinovorum]|uniref:Transcriptional regulator-like domain-containing protein n=1 Tax=Novosphingobium resinovorum TaxID=158500 RepID=A0A1D8A2T3_9SPHN|nr:DUF6499 domain-containing protein [Novosphingobium resinovorum]AOR76392.1 hypothetical protein BES08_06230 [Novosphingobium resinovorum]